MHIFTLLQSKNLGMTVVPRTFFLLLSLLLLLFIFLSDSTGPQILTVDVHSAKDLIRSGHRFLDVRTADEFKAGHVDVENALNIPYMFSTSEGRVKNPDFVQQVSSAFSKDDRLVVGCQSGARSLHATTDLQNAGFKHACNMGGGYAQWVENGFAVKKPKVEL